jgi:hypothetical protein
VPETYHKVDRIVEDVVQERLPVLEREILIKHSATHVKDGQNQVIRVANLSLPLSQLVSDPGEDAGWIAGKV